MIMMSKSVHRKLSLDSTISEFANAVGPRKSILRYSVCILNFNCDSVHYFAYKHVQEL